MIIRSTYLSVIIAKDLLRKTLVSIIIDINKENKVSVLAENRSKDIVNN